MSAANAPADFEKALEVGRPPNIVKLFPNSRALIVSGKVIDRAMRAKGKCMTIAANGRNHFVIRGALAAAQRANAAIILEIAKSECNYCPTNFYNLARQADQVMNELGITVPVAIHADHYAIKGQQDMDYAKTELPSMFEQGVTSVAIDASHLLDHENLLANIELAPLIPTWAGYETEVGEIKGKEGLSTAQEALFQIQGLNANGIFPDWIALNNGTTHGIEASGQGIQVELTAEIHEALVPYRLSGAQHGTSGNSSDRLRRIAHETHTTKANVATALQMFTWGVRVNDYGNALLDEDGNFVKVPSEGVTVDLWNDMVAYADKQGLKGGNYKKLNLPFEIKLCAQSATIRARMAKAVEDFVYELLAGVFNAMDTAPIAIGEILAAGSHDLGPKTERTEDPAQWTKEKIIEKGASIDRDRGPAGNFED